MQNLRLATGWLLGLYALGVAFAAGREPNWLIAGIGLFAAAGCLWMGFTALHQHGRGEEADRARKGWSSSF